MEARNYAGFTALLSAAQIQNHDAAIALLAAGADPDAESDDGYTALHISSRCNALPLVQQLLEEGADIYVRNCFGKMPLYLAAKHGKVEVVEALLEDGADANIETDEGELPLYAAVKRGCSDPASDQLKRVALDGAEYINAQDHNVIRIYPDVDTAKWDSARCRRLEVVKLLLQHRSNVNFLTSHGESALFASCRWGSVDVVDELLRAGADVDLLTPKGESALYEAAKWHAFDIAQALLEAGASVNDLPLSPLSIALEKAQVLRSRLQYESRMVELLLTAGAVFSDENDAELFEQFVRPNHRELALFPLRNPAAIRPLIEQPDHDEDDEPDYKSFEDTAALTLIRAVVSITFTNRLPLLRWYQAAVDGEEQRWRR